MPIPDALLACGTVARHRHAQRGLGLLEAIVALVLLATTASVLLSWMQQNLDTMRRLETREDEIRLKLNAQAWLSTLNPAREPEGQRNFAGMQLRWRSETLARPSAPQLPEAVVSSQWRVGLYRVHLTASTNGPRPVQVELNLLQPGTVPPGDTADPP